jgi:hypothetical protein
VWVGDELDEVASHGIDGTTGRYHGESQNQINDDVFIVEMNR